MHMALPLMLGCALLLPALGSAAAQAAPSPKEPAAQDVAVLAGTCHTCHGPGSQAPSNSIENGLRGIPSLRGRSAAFLLQRMRAFKAIDPARADASATIMPLLLQGYDDAQIKALADWFARGETR